MTTEGTLIIAETITIDYGATFNLGNYENEKISIRITVGPDEDLDAAAARARSFVEGMHAETVARRKRAADIEQAQSRIRDLDRWLPNDRKQAAEAGLTVTFDPPPPIDSDDELAVLQYGVAVREAEQEALQSALAAHREAKWQAQREENRRVREAALAGAVGEDNDDDDFDGDDDDDAFERDIEYGP